MDRYKEKLFKVHQSLDNLLLFGASTIVGEGALNPFVVIRLFVSIQYTHIKTVSPVL